jgi:hypothetical protein
LSGKCEEWPNWSENILVKAKGFGFKDILLGKVAIQSLMMPMIKSLIKEEVKDSGLK